MCNESWNVPVFLSKILKIIYNYLFLSMNFIFSNTAQPSSVCKPQWGETSWYKISKFNISTRIKSGKIFFSMQTRISTRSIDFNTGYNLVDKLKISYEDQINSSTNSNNAIQSRLYFLLQVSAGKKFQDTKYIIAYS